ncbi:hypothetical protein COB21_04575 [Candidatus Aerophobetes bacterium]|uniref:Uncharacterized protein n=1 Tax=Aerophobetes bacterium TaxID=2030807 RepID=A0A2A4X163_UNCAE|nr:MAG: hypothetical protein COB21_04575 [Candidatus Aerophobetes bacterium]
MQLKSKAGVFFTLLALMISPVLAEKKVSPLSILHFSIFSKYSYFGLEKLDKSASQDRLCLIFEDKLKFLQRHDIRKFVVKILNPETYPFFHPSNFSSTPDNFFYFLEKMLQSTEVEILFDEKPFSLDIATLDTVLAEMLLDLDEPNSALIAEFSTDSMPGFYNFTEKIVYFDALIGCKQIPKESKAFRISNVVFACQNQVSPGALQTVINNFDRYRFSGFSCSSPSRLGLGVVLPITGKEFAFANLASFPLTNSIRISSSNRDIGITLPKHFPSSKPYFPSPVWRTGASMADKAISLVNNVYLDMGDDKLKRELYHDKQVLPLPSQYSPKSLPGLAKRLEHIFTSTPYVQGPGYISIDKDSVAVRGKYSFFREGSKEDNGRFVKRQKMGFFLEGFDKMLVRHVVSDTITNTSLQLNAPLSFDLDIENHPYYYSPFAVNWSEPCISRSLVSRIFYLFDVNYTPGKPMAQGDWHLINFLHFLVNTKTESGFLYTRLFTGLDKTALGPSNNLVISDYSAIPNGSPYEEIDWGMGNASF